MNVSEAIRGRVSVKEYEPEPVSREQIEELLELANLAPNHRMTEPLHFRVLGEGAKGAYAEALAGRKTKKLDDADAAAMVREKVMRRHMRVPAMVGVLVEQDADPEVREEDYATAFMAIQNLSLAAVEMGLGTHIKTGAVMDEPSLREALGVGEAQRLVAIVFLGMPAEMPDAKRRVPATERTRWLD
ncbi:MAG TPA: nitroreductase [Longimicrobiales bacterium]|nr:nitroreductase [Longimicrobiales bacterium]